MEISFFYISFKGFSDSSVEERTERKVNQMMEWKKAAEQQWNARAQSWDDRSESIWEDGSRKDIIPFLSKFIPEKSTVLDVGCGNGYSTYQLAKLGYEAAGVDLSSEMIAIAKEKFQHNHLTFLQGDIQQLPFPDGTFDGAMAVTVLEWTPDPLQALLEMKRTIKNDGHLCIGLLGPTAGPRSKGYPRLYGEKVICNSMMPWELMKLASDQQLHYVDGFGVYKKAVQEKHIEGLPLELKQALSFMWVFMFQKR